MTTRRWLLNAAVLFVVALLLRALPAAHVLFRGEVFFRGPDGYYHMRRIVYTIQNFPEVLGFDPYVQFPHGAHPIWPPLFDWVSAALLLPFATGGDWLRVEQAAAWIPPILGGLTAVATWLVARRLFPENAAFGAGALLCVLGGHFVYSRVGALDHHVAVSLVSTLLLGSTIATLGAGDSRTRLRSALATGFWIAAGLLVWPGSVLYATLALAGLAGFALAAPGASEAAARWRALALASGFSALLVAPLSLGNTWTHYGSMSPLVLTNFQPWLLVTVAAIALGTGLASERPSLGSRRVLRGATAFGIGFALVGASLFLSQDLFDNLSDMWRWLAKTEDFQDSVIESAGLFSVRGEFSTFMAQRQLSYLVYAFPVFWGLLLVDGWHSERRAPLLFLLTWAAILFGVTLLQKRFLDTFSVAFAIVSAAGIQVLWNRLRLGSRDTLGRLTFLGILFLLSPLAANYLPQLENIAQRAVGKPLELHPWAASQRHFVEMGHWMRIATPHTRGWYDTSVQPEYGVLAPWSLGHLIQYVARRPAIVDNFGDDVGEENYRTGHGFWSSPVTAAAGTVDALGARYVVVTGKQRNDHPFQFATIFDSLSDRDGSSLEFRGEKRVPAANRFRLVFESRPLGNAKKPYVKVFEVVAGARLRGRAPQGSVIDLTLPVTTNRDRHFEYRDRSVASEDGWFEFVVPYATLGGPRTVSTGGQYTLTCNGRASTARTPESRVQGGGVVLIPDPCAP